MPEIESIESSSPAFRRILVALDASPHSQAALDMAVRLAMGFEATLEGLFIKDENLLRAARLPLAEEVRSHTLPPKNLNDRRVKRQLRYQAEQAEAALQQVAERAEVEHTFRVVEGQVTRELLKAAQEADLLALGKTSTTSSRRRLGTTCETVLSEAPGPVLVLRKAIQRHQPVLTYYDGSEAAATTLRVAAQLALHAGNRLLKVLLPATDEAETSRLRKEVHNQYADLVPQLEIRLLTDTEINRLAALSRHEGPCLFVLPADCTPLKDTPHQRFLYEADCPLLVVR